MPSVITPSVIIEVPAILIDIGVRYRPEISPLELYEASRGAWHVGNRRNSAQYAFAISDNIVREVYRISSWHRAGTTPYRIRPFVSFAVEGRWEFLGSPAEAQIRDKYKACQVASYMQHIQPHSVIYVNC